MLAISRQNEISCRSKTSCRPTLPLGKRAVPALCIMSDPADQSLLSRFCKPCCCWHCAPLTLSLTRNAFVLQIYPKCTRMSRVSKPIPIGNQQAIFSLFFAIRSIIGGGKVLADVYSVILFIPWQLLYSALIKIHSF